MRLEQIEKLQTLSEKLTDVFLDEAEPDKWPGEGIDAANMDQKSRGDRYWCKKNAVATLSLVGRIQHLTGMIRMQSQSGLPDPMSGQLADELDKEVAAAEKEASRLLDKVQEQARKREFDKHVHGKKG